MVSSADDPPHCSGDAPDREHRTSRRHRRNLVTYLRARAKQLRQGEGKDLLVIGQKAAIDALRSETLPARVDSVHFHALSGIDRWGSIAGMVVLGRTLPAPVTVETLAIALTGRAPRSEASASDWWYGSAQRRIRLAGRRSHAVQGEVHHDPVAEANLAYDNGVFLVAAAGNNFASTPMPTSIVFPARYRRPSTEW